MKLSPTRRLALCGTALLPLAARAQPRTITIVVPFAPGGPTDTVTRLVAEAMAAELGQNVVVENTAGAGGTIGANRVAQARPDGTMLLMHHIGHATAATLYRRLPYDPVEGFACLGLVTEVPQIAVARRDFPAATLAELFAVMRQRGDALTIGHAGLGGSDHLAGMLLQREAGRAVTAVAFRGAAPIMTELLAGRIDLYCGQATVLVPHIRADTLRAYAVTADARLAGAPLDAIPTVAEAGHPQMRVTVWHGLYAPRRTPAEMVQRLSAALRVALASPRVIERFAELATAPVAADRATPEFHTRFLAAEVARWRPIIQAAGEFAD
jgi:tripartite-type tricarboxylate transporter receptor subunit TctC